MPCESPLLLLFSFALLLTLVSLEGHNQQTNHRTKTIPDFTDSDNQPGIEPYLITTLPGIEPYLISTGSIPGWLSESVKSGIDHDWIVTVPLVWIKPYPTYLVS